MNRRPGFSRPRNPRDSVPVARLRTPSPRKRPARFIKPGICLFVYGTLMTDITCPLGLRERKRLHREARSLGPATMHGTLYNSVRYPAFIDGGEAAGTVHGELFLLTRPKATFGWLDSYEAPYYARAQRPARLASGEVRTAWVYIFLGPTSTAHAIASGRWRS